MGKGQGSLIFQEILKKTIGVALPRLSFSVDMTNAIANVCDTSAFMANMTDMLKPRTIAGLISSSCLGKISCRDVLSRGRLQYTLFS